MRIPLQAVEAFDESFEAMVQRNVRKWREDQQRKAEDKDRKRRLFEATHGKPVPNQIPL